MPIKVTISPDLLSLPTRLDQRMATTRKTVAELVTIQVKSQVQVVGAIASGKLQNSIKQFPTKKDRVSVGSDVVQAYFIENGRKPGPVPRWSVFKPILRTWAVSKGLNLTDGVLYAIAQKIRKEGYKARRPFAKTKKIVEPQIAALVNSQFAGL